MNRNVFSRIGLLMLLVPIGCAPRASRPAPTTPAPTPAPTIEVSRLNDHLLFFFDGRDPSPPGAVTGKSWVDDAAMALGVGTYVIHRGSEAVVFDTFPSIEQARWVRGYLEQMGIRSFTVVLSHWHLDHIAGNAVYAGSPILSSTATKNALQAQDAAIRAGTVWGPPAIDPLLLPTKAFDDTLQLWVGDIELQLIHVNIHSKDSTIIHLPRDRAVLAGDTLEDPLTYMVEVEELPNHLVGLRRLRDMDFDRLYPNHGDPRVIAGGGYDKTLIDATIDYIEQMLARVHDDGYLESAMEDFIGDALARGWVHAFEAYRAVHRMNLGLVHAHYKDRPAPAPAASAPAAPSAPAPSAPAPSAPAPR